MIMGYKNISITLKNEKMQEAINKHAEDSGDRNRSAYFERLALADIILNGSDEVKKLIRNEHSAEKEVN
jgi:hypothetical protein